MCFPLGTTNATAATTGTTIPSRSMADVQARASNVTRLDPPASVFTTPLGISTQQPRPISRTVLTGALT
jgi:hypothetical protein